MKKILLTIIISTALCANYAWAQKVVVEGGNPYIDCRAMPAGARTNVSKGNGTGRTDGVNYITVFEKFQVAKADAGSTGPTTGDYQTYWDIAVGYTSLYSGSYPADMLIGLSAGTLTNVDPRSTYMNGAPVNADTGCNAYWEGSASDPVTGKTKWRLPTERELHIMWVLQDQIGAVAGVAKFLPEDYPYGSKYYKSASEGYHGTNCYEIEFCEGLAAYSGKNSTAYMRCIREVK